MIEMEKSNNPLKRLAALILKEEIRELEGNATAHINYWRREAVKHLDRYEALRKALYPFLNKEPYKGIQ